MSKANKVEVQKGSIIGNPPTMKQMTHPQKVRQAREERSEIRRAQTLDLHEPKTSRR